MKAGLITVWGIAGKSSIKLKDLEDTTGSEKINPVVFSESDFSSDMYSAGISHTHYFNDNTTGKFIASVPESRIKVISNEIYKDESNLNDYNHRNNEGQLIFNYTFTHKFNARNFVKTGIIYRNIFFNISRITIQLRTLLSEQV